MNKDCTICVYNGVCVSRKDYSYITDCCIAEDPLREAQRKAWQYGVEAFIRETKSYITEHKKKSKYWRSSLSTRE